MQSLWYLLQLSYEFKHIVQASEIKNLVYICKRLRYIYLQIDWCEKGHAAELYESLIATELRIAGTREIQSSQGECMAKNRKRETRRKVSSSKWLEGFDRLLRMIDIATRWFKDW